MKICIEESTYEGTPIEILTQLRAQCHLVSKEGTSQRQHTAKRKQAVCCLLRHQGMTTKRIGKSALKRMFKSQELCYSIGEAGRRFLRQLTSIFSTEANGRNISHKHGFKNGWRNISKEELSANMYCIREINLIGMRFLCLPDDYGLCNQFAEVVHGELGKNLLENELHLFFV